MLKERLYSFIISLFFSLLIVYIINKPPTVIVKHPDINQISNVVLIDDPAKN